ncbi:glycosyl hydrolase family 32 [Demequina sp.]|uniref:glycosyl hydrolase family 32 n=1 Tax=Demequina sp. TaxID=2050685 RepID=UPI0025BB6244|nr:glycosyl hydrolase family 32 [Demequina sp.]
MLSVDGRWVWDFWIADDGDAYHLYYLNAPDSLDHEDLRHRNAQIDHAVSTDLVEWSLAGNVLAAAGGQADDATACWTGCVVSHDGRWTMLYTGSRFLTEVGPKANLETILAADSADLDSWRRRGGFAIRADARWYEVLGSSAWPEEAWRDPWVERDGSRWVMYITARANHGAIDDRGVMGYAVSEDLETWHVQPPLSEPGAGFAHLEVPQLVEIDGQWVVVFSCPTSAMSRQSQLAGRTGGIWSVPVDGPGKPFDASHARLLHDESLYSGRVVYDRQHQPQLLGFHAGVGERFRGVISDPLPLTLTSEGYLAIASDLGFARLQGGTKPHKEESS